MTPAPDRPLPTRGSSRTRWRLAPAVVILLASACSPSGEVTPTSLAPLPSAATSTTTTPPPRPIDPAYEEVIPLDDAVRTATLDNGLTYYVRSNDAPGGRVQLRLVVDAGSVLEDDDQSGGAHFLEHMLFNGTQRWPANELVAVLEQFGARFGPDVNAFTSYDETVYELQVATQDPALVETAFDVLAEWAQRATISQEEVEAERGVVVEEWRLRDQGVAGRIGAQIERLLLAGTPYEHRPPIGDVDVLRTTDAQELRRFYTDWYRPDLMAVIAVGDLPADQMEAAIVERFGDMGAPPESPPRPVIEVVPDQEPSVVSFIDPELPSAFAEVLFPAPAGDPGSFGAVRDRIGLELAFDMLSRRLDEDVAAGDAAFYSAGYVVVPVARALEATGIELDAEAEDLGEAVLTVLEEVERIRRFGFGEQEMARAVAARRSLVEQLHSSQSSRQDSEFADRLVAHHLTGLPLPTADGEYDLERRVLDVLTLDDVQRRFTSLMDATAPAVLVVGPDESGEVLPDERQLREIVAAAATADLEPRPDTAVTAASLMTAPQAVEVIDRSQDGSGTTWLDFANGARVGLLETSISENAVTLLASSPGGFSLVEPGDVTEASLAADIIAQSGLGEHDRVELGRLLSGRVVSLSPFISDVEEGLFGDAATEDLETLFQLVHLTMTEPRVDAAAVEALLGQIRPFAADPDSVAGVALTRALFAARYGEDNDYYRLFPPLAELDDFDADAALAAFVDRFGDAGDFTFVLVGDFDLRTAEELAAAYLGTLPGTDRIDTPADHQPEPPPGVTTAEVEAGRDPQGAVTFLFTATLDSTVEDEVHARLLELVLASRVRDRLREALAATYSPIVTVDLVESPDELVETFIQISGDPDRLDEVSRETVLVLEDVVAAGPDEGELAAARQQLIREYELFSNELWAELLVFYEAHPERSITEVFGRLDVVGETTADDLRSLAAIALPTGRYIEVRQRPLQ